MVSSKVVSYADRAKSGRPSTLPAKSSPSGASTPPGSTSEPSQPAKPSLTATPAESGKSDDSPSTRVPNGVDTTSSVGTADHLPGSSHAPPTVNGNSSTPPTASSSVAPAMTLPQTKQNAWAMRGAARTTPPNASSQSLSQPPTNNTQASSNSSSAAHQRKPPSSESRPAAATASSATQTGTNPLTSASPSSGQSHKASKKKGPKAASPTQPVNVPATQEPPSFDEKSSWPAPSEAVANNHTGGSQSRKDNQSGDDEGKKPVNTHSRDSSSAAAGTPGNKKQKWVAIPPAELRQAAVEAAQPQEGMNGGRGRRQNSGDADGRRNRSHAGPGGTTRSSGQNSKRSSAGPSPARTQPLPLTNVSGTGPPLNVNAPPFTGRISHLNAPGILRSHPHSPLTRSPFHSSHSQSLVNSPRMGPGSSPPKASNYSHPRTYPNSSQNTPPQPAPPVTKKKVHRPSPSKSSAVGGDIPQLPPDNQSFKPVFGSLEPAIEGGLGLTVESDGKSERLSSGETSKVVEAASDVVRWDEMRRVPTEAERMMKTHGKYGIGVQPEDLRENGAGRVDANKGKKAEPLGESSAENQAGDEGEGLPLSHEEAAVAEAARSPKHKWSFGSLDGMTGDQAGQDVPPGANDFAVVDYSRRPPYTNGSPSSMPYGDPSAPNGVPGYSYDGRVPGGSPMFGQRAFGDERRMSPVDGFPMSYPPDGGVNGYSHPRGHSGGRRMMRGGPRSGGRGYGPRPPMMGNPGYRNAMGPPSSGPPAAGPYAYPPQGYDFPMGYPPIPPPVDYHQTMDHYAPPSSAPPQTPGNSHPPLSATEAPYTPHTHYPYPYPPPPPGVPYGPPMPYYPPYPVPGAPNVGIPMLYPIPAYPPNTSYGSAPPVPSPVTNVGYPLDNVRYLLLGQVEYYFSVQNMSSDLFLRKQMDSQGWIDVALIASFNRVRSLTSDINTVREMMALSVVIELSSDGEKCRMMNNGWEPFLLPPGGDSQPQTLGHTSSELPPEGQLADNMFLPSDNLNNPPPNEHNPPQYQAIPGDVTQHTVKATEAPSLVA
ncbi:hypothetical protein FRB99_006087 [Tulasnella sp. 403]|nr:hypothetical protein FRB99_006087 [Tulasnella sp. 403]